jgi:hypothetical protein
LVTDQIIGFIEADLAGRSQNPEFRNSFGRLLDRTRGRQIDRRADATGRHPDVPVGQQHAGGLNSPRHVSLFLTDNRGQESRRVEVSRRLAKGTTSILDVSGYAYRASGRPDCLICRG